MMAGARKRASPNTPTAILQELLAAPLGDPDTPPSQADLRKLMRALAAAALALIEQPEPPCRNLGAIAGAGPGEPTADRQTVFRALVEQVGASLAEHSPNDHGWQSSATLAGNPGALLVFAWGTMAPRLAVLLCGVGLKGADCPECRKGFHCRRCLCCIPLAQLADLVRRAREHETKKTRVRGVHETYAAETDGRPANV